TSGTIAGRSSPTNGAFSVADPRYRQAANWNHRQQFGVIRWDESSPTIPGQTMPGQGTFSVAAPRPNGVRHSHVYRVVRRDQPAGTVTGGQSPSSGGPCIADPRSPHPGKADNSLSRGHYGPTPLDQN